MKKKTKQLLLVLGGLIALVVVAFIFNVYIYGTAKVHYCSKILRESIPVGESLTDERFKVYTDCYQSLGVIDTLRLIAGKSPVDSDKANITESADEMTVIREFMADPDRELAFTGTDLPMPYFRVGKVTKMEGGENMEAVGGWTRQVNVYEDKNPLPDSCNVYQYHVDPRSHTLTQAVTRSLRPSEIEALEEKGTPCARHTNQMLKISKAEAEKIAFEHLERAIPNLEKIQDQFIYTQNLGGQSHNWIWEDKDYQLPEGLSGRPYEYPVIRMTVFGNGQIIYQNTVPLFEN